MRSLIVAWSILLLPLAAGAQSELRPGVRVRVEAPGVIAGRLSGTVVSQTADSIVIASPDLAPLSLPVNRITSLEISHGSSRGAGAGRGAKWGLGLGAITGVLLVYTARKCDLDGRTPCSTPEGRDKVQGGERVQFTAAGAITGVIYGALFGLLFPVEHWDQFDLSLAPKRTSRGLGLSLSHGF